MLINPTPDTAPRTKLFRSIDCSAGMASTKTLRSQKFDHGITINTRPTSRKYAMNSSRRRG